MYHVVFSFLQSGLIWSEVKQLWDIGLHEYVNDMWNVIDFVTNSLYVATVALRVVSYFQVSQSLFAVCCLPFAIATRAIFKIYMHVLREKTMYFMTSNFVHQYTGCPFCRMAFSPKIRRNVFGVGGKCVHSYI